MGNLLVAMDYSRPLSNSIINELKQQILIVYEICILKSIIGTLFWWYRLSTLYFYSVITICQFRY